MLTLLATLSSATALAVERANTDLLIFVIIVVGVCACRYSMLFRLAAYALITVAGLLKFYPMVALIIALRERPVVVTIIALGAGGALAALAFFYHDEIVRMATNLPPASFFTLQFSATDLPGGLGVIAFKIMTKILHRGMTSARAVDALLYKSLLVLLTVQALVVAFWFERRWQLRSAIAQLSAPHSDFLVVGGSLVCGCFFFSHAVIYKAMFFLLTIPGLLALSHQPSWPAIGTVFRSTSVAVVFVLWFVFFEWCVGALGLGRPPSYMVDDGQAGPVGYLLWLCNELAWWWIITVLIAVLLAFFLNSPLWSVLARTSPEFVRGPRGRRPSSPASAEDG